MSAKEPKLPDIVTATEQFEKWASRHVNLIRSDVDLKHREHGQSRWFPFFRATFYRFAQYWPLVCPKLRPRAPQVLAVGDLHIDNFGTWRDLEGRLIWGVNDFDEAWPAAYTVDLVRLLASAYLAMEEEHLSLARKEAYQALEQGYRDSIAKGGNPFVLAEHHRWLRLLALNKLRDPVTFWEKINSIVPELQRQVPLRCAEDNTRESMPFRAKNFELRSRIAGLGSLGHPRVIAVVTWHDAHIVREAKQLTPSAWVWAKQLRRRTTYCHTSSSTPPSGSAIPTFIFSSTGSFAGWLPIAAALKSVRFLKNAMRHACCITWDGKRLTFISAAIRQFPPSSATLPAGRRPLAAQSRQGHAESHARRLEVLAAQLSTCRSAEITLRICRRPERIGPRNRSSSTSLPAVRARDTCFSRVAAGGVRRTHFP